MDTNITDKEFDTSITYEVILNKNKYDNIINELNNYAIVTNL